jgi:hypothetical protein
MRQRVTAEDLILEKTLHEMTIASKNFESVLYPADQTTSPLRPRNWGFEAAKRKGWGEGRSRNSITPP